jgi:hypothetical protein
MPKVESIVQGRAAKSPRGLRVVRTVLGVGDCRCAERRGVNETFILIHTVTLAAVDYPRLTTSKTATRERCQPRARLEKCLRPVLERGSRKSSSFLVTAAFSKPTACRTIAS